jgi:succinate dehydrogenase/fumarate reductase cytochrome b subunit (b558 family)
MSEAATVTAAPAKDSSFLLWKLHSLSGIVPIGGFLLFHLFENMKIGLSPDQYEDSIKHLWSVAPRGVFYAIEFFVLLVPILFHSLYGFLIWYRGESNTGAYGYRRNWMYTLQRWSGLIALAYMAFHVWQLRIAPGLVRDTDADLVKYREVFEAITPVGFTVAYLVGGIAAAFHLGNGLFGFAYSWGLAVGRKAQRNVEALGMGVFVLLSAAVIYTVIEVHLKPF